MTRLCVTVCMNWYVVSKYTGIIRTATTQKGNDTDQSYYTCQNGTHDIAETLPDFNENYNIKHSCKILILIIQSTKVHFFLQNLHLDKFYTLYCHG